MKHLQILYICVKGPELFICYSCLLEPDNKNPSEPETDQSRKSKFHISLSL